MRVAGPAVLVANLLLSGAVLAADTTRPTAPGQPIEGASISQDEDYDTNGQYLVAWPAAVDGESGIAAYEVQEQAGASAAWIQVATSRKRWVSLSGRADGLRYAYRVRALSRARLLSAWSPVSDGIAVDTTAPRLAIIYPEDGMLLGRQLTMGGTGQ
jgi:hypothetical protein